MSLKHEGDATDLIASIVTRIGNTNIDESSLVGAIKSALFDAGSSANKLSVDALGRVRALDANGNAIAGASAVASLQASVDGIDPPTAAENATAVWGEANRTLTEGTRDTEIDAVKATADKIETMIEDDSGTPGASQFTAEALDQGPQGSGGGGGGVSDQDLDDIVDQVSNRLNSRLGK